MNASGTSQDRNPVEALADDFLRRQRAGERPTLDEYCRRHPELAADIRDVFPVLIRMEDLRSDGPDDSTGCVAVHAATRLERLGDYRILREVGRGGMGVVYEAEQESLGRRVALKVLPDAALTDAQQVLRFQREARAAARLHHTNIVPVFGVGQDDGHYYYVMQFIPGMGLDAVLEELRRLRRGAGSTGPPRDRGRSNGAVSAADVAEAILTGRFSLAEGVNRTPGPGTTLAASSSAPLRRPAIRAPGPADSSVVSLPGASADSLARSDPDRTFFRSVARIGLQVAEALEYANRQGVLHRDVKPSNLLLDPKGNVWVADFGLAKAADTEDITHSGDIVGTVRYMATERFRGKCDARSDVYALGLTLYELLALRPAFEASDRHELMRRVMSEEPERLRKIVPNIPRNLETIVETAIAREPCGRYASAAALAEDLQRYQEDRPIMARRVSAVEQAWRWALRNPAVASLAAGLLVALLAGLTGVTWQWRQAVANLSAAQGANRKAQARFDLAMEAVRAFTTGASKDVILKEKALEGLRKKLLGQSQLFYEKLRDSLEGERDRSSRSALAEALLDAASLYMKVDAPQKALDASSQSLALHEALMHERPGDTQARRDLARSHLALSEVLYSASRFEAAQAELAQARSILDPLVRERPDDGGARYLRAAVDSLGGDLLHSSGQPIEGRAMMEHARGLFEALIRDNPPYGLPTAADGLTEYRRGLVEVLARTGYSYQTVGQFADAVRVREAARDVLEELAAGPFADDGDRQRLGVNYQRIGNAYSFLGREAESYRACNRSLAILQGLSDANPAVVTYKLNLAVCEGDVSIIHSNAGDFANGRQHASRALSVLGSMTAAERENAGSAEAEGTSEQALGVCDLGVGRPGDALTHIVRSVNLFESLVRDHPEHAVYETQLGNALAHRAVIELSGGLPEPARQAMIRLRELAERTLGEHPDLRFVLQWKISSLLLESLIDLKGGRVSEAARSADQAAEALEGLRSPLLGQERFLLSTAHALLYAVGRPAGPGRPAEHAGIRSHADLAIAELREAERLGFRYPAGFAMISEVLGHPPEIERLLSDQRFPADPFRPGPGSDHDEPAAEPRGPRP